MYCIVTVPIQTAALRIAACQHVVIRPPDIVVGGQVFTAILFLLLSSIFLFVSYPSSSLNRTQPKPTTCMLGSECDLKMYVRNLGYPFPTKNRGPRTLFSTASQLNCKFNGLYFRRETCHGMETTRGLLHRQKVHELWSTNGLKLDLRFTHPP